MSGWVWGPEETHYHAPGELERLLERLDDRDVDVVSTARPRGAGAPAWLLELDEAGG